MSLTLRGAGVVTPGKDLGVTDVRVEAGRIAAVGSRARPAAGDYPVTHARHHRDLRIVSDYATAEKPKFNI